jgi:hypothetical protein
LGLSQGNVSVCGDVIAHLIDGANLRQGNQLRLSLLGSIWLASIAMLVPKTVDAQQGPFVYVPNATDNNVSVIDTPTN